MGLRVWPVKQENGNLEGTSTEKIGERRNEGEETVPETKRRNGDKEKWGA